jgi:hypothetical protein
MKAMPVSVHHEWGTLREVIVGIGDDLIMPVLLRIDILQPWY